MFYSHLLLSKKGTLGVVWMAAHSYKRLKKEQVVRTNVSASVDKILDEEVLAVTHRILAFLLLGVVRIYSKKVEYLYDDCHEALNKLISYETGKGKNTSIGNRPIYVQAVSLPDTFELDAFDLELAEDLDLVGGNVRSRDEVMLEDVRQKDITPHGLLYKGNTDNTQPRDIFSPPGMEISLAGMEMLLLEDQMEPMELDEAEEEQMHSITFKDDLMAIVVAPAEEAEANAVQNLSNNAIQSVLSPEVRWGTGLPLEDHSDPTVLGASGKQLSNDILSNDIIIGTDFPEPVQDVEFNHDVTPLTQGSDLAANSMILHREGTSSELQLGLNLSREIEKAQCSTFELVKKVLAQLGFDEEEGEEDEADELNDFPEPIDEVEPVVASKRKYLEVITPESENFQNVDAFPSTAAAPNPKLSVDPSISQIRNDATSPNGSTIPTPAAKECGKVRKMRKVLLDSTTILSHEVLRSGIENPSDTKRERKKVPSTLLQTWRKSKATPVSSKPLFSGITADLDFLHCDQRCMAAISALELSGHQDNNGNNVQSPVQDGFDEQNDDDDFQSLVQDGIDEEIVDVEPPVLERSSQQILIAPSTPASYLSLRPHEIGAIVDSDPLDPSSSSLDSIEKPLSSDGGFELDAVLCEDTVCDGDSVEKCGYSARTRVLGSYLHKRFTSQRRKEEEEVVNVSEILEGKSKGESARLFYELLVLKSRDCIRVEQENAYDDILVREASNLKLAIEGRKA